MVLVGWFCVNRRFTIVKRWFRRIHGSRSLYKSMKNACENRVRKRYAELNENGAKMEPKWEPEIVEILKKTGKKASLNRCEKKVPNGSADARFNNRRRCARGQISGPAGEGFREGVRTGSVLFQMVPM